MFTHVAGLVAFRSVVCVLVCARVEMSMSISSDPKLLEACVSLPGQGGRRGGRSRQQERECQLNSLC